MGAESVEKLREYDATPGRDVVWRIERFLFESSHARNRAYTVWPRTRTEMIASVGRPFATRSTFGRMTAVVA